MTFLVHVALRGSQEGRPRRDIEERRREKKRESQWCHVSPSETIVGDGEQSECRTIQQCEELRSEEEEDEA